MSGHFQNGGVVQPSLDFSRELSIECLENKIGLELGDNGKTKISCKIPIYVYCENVTVKHYGRMWNPSKKMGKSETKT